MTITAYSAQKLWQSARHRILLPVENLSVRFFEIYKTIWLNFQKCREALELAEKILSVFAARSGEEVFNTLIGYCIS
jgi:hypothetical protein